jgi:iron-sulfur cluster repair protein YtfE (RIC family)
VKRHPGLHALSQHHHFALIESLEIRRAASQPGLQRQAAMRQLAEKFLAFWKKSGSVHFREEEDILLPAYARHADIARDADVRRMLADHVAIRALIEKVEQLLRSNRTSEAELTELGDRLRAHVRLEEDIIFPRMESLLPDDELSALGEKLTRLHPQDTCEL